MKGLPHIWLKDKGSAATESTSIQSGDYSKVQVLVVEDNFFSRVAVINLLEQYGFLSHSATDGQEAFELVKERF